jgi:hypothetical protein
MTEVRGQSTFLRSLISIVHPHDLIAMVESLSDLWWQGVTLWYNEQDYAAAMDVWEKALIRHDHPADDPRQDNYINTADSMISEVQKAICPSNNDSPTQVSPLWLFLGGCYLDAGRHEDARRSLRACIQHSICKSHYHDTNTISSDYSDTDEVCIRAIQEYMASWQEDSNISAALCSELCRRAIQLVQASTKLSSRVRQNWNDPYLRPGFMYPKIKTQPFYSSSKSNIDERSPWIQHLEDPSNFAVIQQECLHLLQSHSQNNFHRVGSGHHRDGAGAQDGMVVASGSWKEVVLFASTGQQSHLAPQTCQIIERYIPDAVSLAKSGGGEVIFSLMEPGTRIEPHCATTNLRLTAHLGIVVPGKTDGKCRIRVRDQWHEWKQGKVFVFDDAYEHEVENTTNEIRVVLLIRFWHPSLPVKERQRALDQALQRKQEDSLHRFNPPLPVAISKVEDRAMERSHCRHCGQTGYASLRVVDYSSNQGSFQCHCGHIL